MNVTISECLALENDFFQAMLSFLTHTISTVSPFV